VRDRLAFGVPRDRTWTQ